MIILNNLDTLAFYQLFKKVTYEILIPNFGKVRPEDLVTKRDGSPCTRFDLASEKALRQGLYELTGIDVVGEESIEADPKLFRKIATQNMCWVIDPIDGTGPYKRGVPSYGILAALVVKGETRAGFIYVPRNAVIDKHGCQTTPDEVFITTQKSMGCTVNGKPFVFANRPQSFADSNYSFVCRNSAEPWAPLLLNGLATQPRNRNNSADDYAAFVAGEHDVFFIAEGPKSIWPWDHAAGTLAMAEAGGFAAVPNLRSGRYSPTKKHDCLLVASSPALWKDAYRFIHSRIPQICKARL